VQASKTLRSRTLSIIVFALSFLICYRGLNLYAPLTEGWWHIYVRWLNEGRIPYRDFEFLLPPGYLYGFRFATMLFGERVEALRFVGGAQVSLIGLLLHLLLKRVCGEYTSAVIALFTVIYIRSGPVFVSYDYHYLSMVLFLAVVLGVSLVEDAENHKEASKKELIAIGVIAGFALSVKQSQGIWTVATLVCALLVYNSGNWQKLIRKLSLTALGITAFWIPVIVWFRLKGVAPLDLLHQLSLPDRPKGPVGEMFFGWIRDVLSYEQQKFGFRRAMASLSRLVQFVVWFPLLAIVLRISRNRTLSSVDSPRAVSVLILSTFAIGWWWSNGSNRPLSDQLIAIWNRFLEIAPVGSLILALLMYLIIRFTERSKRSCPNEQTLLFATIAVVWACGMSAGITEIGAYLPVAVSMALFVRFTNRHPLAIALVAVLLVSALVGSWQYRVTEGFYSWWGYKTPRPQEASVSFEAGLMRGLHTSPEIKREYTKIQDFLASSLTCEGEVLVFPHLASILIDANSLPTGRLGTYWYDFASNTAVREEALRITKSQTKAIVILELSPVVLELHEAMFNEGKELAHRELIELLRTQTREMNHVVSLQVDSGSVLNAWFSDCVITANGRKRDN